MLGLPGREPAHARFDRFELMRVLADAGKDPGAYTQLSDTQRVYTALALDAAATDGNPLGPDTIGRDAVVEDRREAVGATAQRSAAVFGALDFGHNTALEQAGETRDQATNQQLEANGKAASVVVGQALGHVPVPGVPARRGRSPRPRAADDRRPARGLQPVGPVRRGRAVFAPVGDAVADYGQSYDDAQRVLQDNDRG